VVHLDGLDLAANVRGLEADVVARVQDTRLDTADRDRPDAGDGVHVLNRKPEVGVCRRFWLWQVVECVEQNGTVVPVQIARALGDVIALEGRDRDELGVVGVELDLLEQFRDLVDGFPVATFLVVVRARKTCSWVCGCTPSSAATTRTALSAWLAPVIMFLTKSRWPGQSTIVNS
jgi:hypothetical protein